MEATQISLVWFCLISTCSSLPIPPTVPPPLPTHELLPKVPSVGSPCAGEQMCSVACRLHLNSTAFSAVAITPSGFTGLAASARY